MHHKTNSMKFISLSLFIILTNTCGSNKNFPATMPADFKIEYHLDGGMVNTHNNIILQKIGRASCRERV